MHVVLGVIGFQKNQFWFIEEDFSLRINYEVNTPTSNKHSNEIIDCYH